MEWKDITEAALRENRQDIVEVLTGTDATSKLTAEVKTLKESVAAKDAELAAANAKLAADAAEKATLAKANAISEEIKAAKLDASDKVVCSEAFMESLNLAADAPARKRLIDDRVVVAKGRNAAIPGTAPFANVGGTAKNKSDFLKSIR
jgi:hypothetical protein